jgi:hypothetical protein
MKVVIAVAMMLSIFVEYACADGEAPEGIWGYAYYIVPGDSVLDESILITLKREDNGQLYQGMTSDYGNTCQYIANNEPYSHDIYIPANKWYRVKGYKEKDGEIWIRQYEGPYYYEDDHSWRHDVYLEKVGDPPKK